MTPLLHLGDPTYSSWSMRIGLLVARFALPVETRTVVLYTPDFEAFRRRVAPVRTVPALELPDGTVIGESLAIAEELATRFPHAPIWPADPSARARARMLAAEMHAGFAALRAACPMNLRRGYVPEAPDPEVEADLARIEALWAHARADCTDDGPWLCGDYSAADAFFAPVAARIAGYALPVSRAMADYVAAHLGEPAFEAWQARARRDGPDQPVYALERPTRPWPVDAAGLNVSSTI